MDDDLRRILDRIPGLDPDRAIVTPLAGGLTNRNYRIDAPGGPFALRIGGPHPELLGINRRHEHAATAAAAALGIGPEVVAFIDADAVLVTRFIQGTPVTPEAAARPEMLARIAASIRQVHAGPPIPGSFSPFLCIRTYLDLARRRSAALPAGIEPALNVLNEIEQASGSKSAPVPCHNDLLAANFIDDGTTIRILDWEYAAMGDPLFDLANFAANLMLDQSGCANLLDAYGGPAGPAVAAKLQLLGTVSDLRESAWGFLQTTASTLDVDYPRYGREHLDRFRSLTTGPAFAAWLRAARG